MLLRSLLSHSVCGESLKLQLLCVNAPYGAAAATTATADTVDQVKGHLLSVYWEQLCARSRPVSRTDKGWFSILSNIHQVCKQRLQLVHTIPELFDIAVRVLKEADFKEKFLQLASEELDSIPALEQECFLKATHESPSFERDILVQESVIFEHLLCRQEQPAPIDCDPEENFGRKRKFSVPLKPAPASGSALDLDSE